MIDVSEYQGRINWLRVHRSGVRRAYVKLGEWPIGRRTPRVDPQAARNLRLARRRGIHVGVYWYAHPSRSVLAEIRAFTHLALELGAVRCGDLPPALDLEVTEGQAWPELARFATTWLEHVGSFAVTPAVLYSYVSFYRRLLEENAALGDWPAWVADWRDPAHGGPPLGKSIVFWQWSDHGHVPGIAAPVDFSRVTPLALALQPVHRRP